jgi:hypothetical protein
MEKFIPIQANVFCEPCRECGSRPVVEQVKGKYKVRCPKDKSHYQTNPGVVDVNDWNTKNKAHPSLGNKEASNKKAS